MIWMPLLRWWLLLELIGLLALPLTMKLLRFLPERGVTFRRPLGLVLAGYLFWLLASLGALGNTTGGAAFAVLLMGALSVGIGWRERRVLGRELRRLRPYLALETVLFVAALMAFGLFRAYNPDIAGTEKPMEFAFINGILRSPTFPPRDPWLAGYGISYYYFGFLISAMLTRLAALPSGMTFNLTGTTLFALTLSGSFGLVYNLVQATRRRDASDESLATVLSPLAVVAGALGALMVGLMGNLVGVFELIRARGWGSDALWRFLDVRNLQTTSPSATWYPDDVWWWWRASRVIHDRDLAGNTLEVISEFPFFSFLLGDVHPHVLALPFVLLALALALNLWLGRAGVLAGHTADTALSGIGLPARAGRLRPGRWLDAFRPGNGGDLILWGVLLGALGFLNTWDYPIYLALFVAVYAMVQFVSSEGESGWIGRSVLMAILLGVSGVVLYLPFYLGLRSQAGGIGLVSPFIKTQWQQFMLMFGTQIVMVGGLAAVVTAAAWRGRRVNHLPTLARVWGGVWLLFTLAMLLLGWWTAALTLSLLAVSGALLLWGTASLVGNGDALLDDSSLFALLMLVVCLGLVSSVEFVYLSDIFSTRMNTVFKFYYQGWVLLSLAAAFGIALVWRRLKGAAVGWRLVGLGWVVLCALLVLGGLSYTAAATVSKADAFRSDEPTLDGTRYVAVHRPLEDEAIRWLRDHAIADAVMVEATGGSYSAHNWISAHTGIPTLLGWGGHQLQWRGSYELPGQREPVLDTIYRGYDIEETRQLLQAYDVDYVLVGPLERATYEVGPAVLSKLDQLMARALENEQFIIYQRTW